MEVVGLGSILWVENFVAMREFYSRVLELNVADEQDSEGWIQFLVGDGRFALHAIPPEYLTDSGGMALSLIHISEPTRPY